MVIIILVKAETNRITGISSKTTYFTYASFSYLLFPTHSDRQEENIWINMHYIEMLKNLKS